MLHIQKLAFAEQDLINIWLYTFQNWGEVQADRYLDDLNEALKLLAESPLFCRERHELSPPMRIHHVAHHLIVYLVSEDCITVVRVLHESMDIETELTD